MKFVGNASDNEVMGIMSRMLREGIANGEVRQLALSITAGVDDPISAVYDWMIANYRYIPDPEVLNSELFIAPKVQVRRFLNGEQIAGDCDDISLMSASLLGSIGYQVRIVVIGQFNHELDHAYAEVYSAPLGQWLTFDPSDQHTPLGWELSYRRIEYVTPA